MHKFLVEAYKITRNTFCRNHVQAQEVGGCFDALRRYYSLMPGDPHFSFDRSVPLAILHLYWPKTKKFWMLEVEKKEEVFFKHHAFENFNHRGNSEFAKKGLNNSTVKEGFLP